jgi:hypothetical protein
VEKQDWLPTPGLSYLENFLIPDAVEALTGDKAYQPVLIQGPTGAGKSYVLDLLLHKCGFSPDKVQKINCAAIPKDLFESQVFGHVKGAFTGATNEFQGYLGRKGVDVVVFDEIGTMPKYIQAKLLVFLDNGEYLKLGSNTPDRSKAKIIGITNEDLGEKSRLREDFAYRFQVITLPGLHARRPDVLTLLAHFAPDVRWTRYDLLRILSYHWPGNLRELKRFGLMAQKHHKGLEKWFTGSKGVVDYLKTLRYIEWGLDRPLEGAWERQTLAFDPRTSSTWYESFTDHRLQGKISEWCPHLALVSGQPICLRLDQQSVERGLPEREVREGNDFDSNLEQTGPGNELKQYECWREDLFEYEWEIWCELFHQDPQINGDILSLISEGKMSRPRNLCSVFESDPEYHEEYESLKQYILRKFFSVQGSIPEEGSVNGLTSVAPFEEVLARVYEKIAPQLYKAGWIKHFVESGARPADVARKYGLSQKTVAEWFRKHKKKQT